MSNAFRFNFINTQNDNDDKLCHVTFEHRFVYFSSFCMNGSVAE